MADISKFILVMKSDRMMAHGGHHAAFPLWDASLAGAREAISYAKFGAHPYRFELRFAAIVRREKLFDWAESRNAYVYCGGLA